ncbi:hypothetical protein VTK73DRAFT_5869 [Phialemonium thermophilum]|uniref:DUF1765-domain-containing protein n=1 Tax=Phialemonium thermophilum TaxID=223376 RepID=A0ABR3XY53_9PEZI
MNGPTLSMALAVDPSRTFQNSQSTPELVTAGLGNFQPASPTSSYRSNGSSRSSGNGSRTGGGASSEQQPLRLDLKSLPSLPAFDVPSIDFDLGFDYEFRSSLRSTLLHDDGKPSERPLLAKGSTTDTREHGRANLRPVAAAPPVSTITATTAAATTATAWPAATAAVALDSKAERLSRRLSMIDKPRLWLPTSKSTTDIRRHALAEEAPEGAMEPHNDAGAGERGPGRAFKPLQRSRTVESFADFARLSWMSSSRSPSPPNRSERIPSPGDAETKALRSRSREANSLDQDANKVPDSSSSTSRALNRASIYLTRIKQRPQSVFVKSTSSSSTTTLSVFPTHDRTVNRQLDDGALDSTSISRTTPVLPAAVTTTTSTPDATLSVDTHSLQIRNVYLDPRNSSQTASSSASDCGGSEEGSSQSTSDTHLTMPHPTTRDPLWATFRNLDADFSRFVAKSSTQARVAAVRGTLLPFLLNTARHPSNGDKSVLAPEDVDRRATILSKWWNGLLDMLDTGRIREELGLSLGSAFPNVAGPHPVEAADRPLILDATTMIMMRPEWRVSTSYYQPLVERSPFEKVRARSWTQSSDDNSDLDSSSSAFITESAEHNVRTMFVANLLAQMAIVVERMSMRHVPPTLVNWCGRACAYAFLFAPGVADVLVRLWRLKPDLVRRVADEFGLPRRSKGESEDIVALFPPSLSELGWTSVKKITDKLRLAARLPLLASKIPWHGPWISRWRGGDTDLLFIFAKYFYILSEEFMPSGLPLVERARAPAFVLIHAQLLSTLDSTIHRQAAVEAMMGPPLVDAPHGADASISALSLPPNNLLRGMEENRLIILLRDMLSENSFGVLPGVKLAFAEAFMALMRGAAKRTSRYEQAPCFILCDFLEEAFAIYKEFQDSCNEARATSQREWEVRPELASAEAYSATDQVDLIDWPFWFEVCRLILCSNNTMAEVRMLSFIFTSWDIIAATPARKEALCLDWLLTEEVFEKFFNNWSPMVRAYYMRLLCWRICRDSGSPNELDVRIFLLASQRLKTVWSHYLWLKRAADIQAGIQPSTAPSFPVPGKRFVIIRTEVQQRHPGIYVPFDQFSTPIARSRGGLGFRGTLTGNNGQIEASTADASEGSSAASYRKKWFQLGKMLSFASASTSGSGQSSKRHSADEELEEVRQETAAAKATKNGVHFFAGPPPPPPKQATTSAVASESESISSTGSSPVFEATQFVFRFALSWHSQAAGPPRDRILTRPRLPAPAQARVSARSAAMNSRSRPDGSATVGETLIRSESPPPIAAGLPLPTRRYSGLMQTGLVSEARNAKPLEETEVPARGRRSLSLNIRNGVSSDTPSNRSTTDGRPVRPSFSIRRASASEAPAHIFEPASAKKPEKDDGGRTRRDDSRSSSDEEPASQAVSNLQDSNLDAETARLFSSVQPTKPAGASAAGAVYAGRALAEWSIIVNECNSFVDRRRDEGVLGLSEVEVPSLSIEGLGMRRPA